MKVVLFCVVVAMKKNIRNVYRLMKFMRDDIVRVYVCVNGRKMYGRKMIVA